MNAMEIVHTFPVHVGKGGPIQGLQKFKEWLSSYDLANEILEAFNKEKNAHDGMAL